MPNYLTPRPFGAWVDFYEKKTNGKFELFPAEELVFRRERGFFTWTYNKSEHYLVIPKMVGDGKHWRPIIHELLMECMKRDPACKGVCYCTTRDPKIYLRITGGKLLSQTYEDGKCYSFIAVTHDETKVSRLW